MVVPQDSPDFPSSLLHIYENWELLYMYVRHTWCVKEPDMDDGKVLKVYVAWSILLKYLRFVL